MTHIKTKLGKKKIRWSKGLKTINFPIRETDPYKAIEMIEMLGLPKHRIICFELKKYKDGFVGYPNVYIQR